MDDGKQVDYILQVLSNEVRRKIIRLLAEEGPLTYSSLMRKIGIDDSGTFGFHIRKMRRLLSKTDMGEYKLNDLGKKAYEMLNQLLGEEREVIEETKDQVVSEREVETLIISGRLRYNLTKDVVEMYHKKGVRLSLDKIVKLVIHDMPRELFDNVVESISNCVVIYTHSNLYDLVEKKSYNILAVKKFEEEISNLERLKMDVLGEISSGIVDTIMADLPAIVSESLSHVNKRFMEKRRFELVLNQDVNIPQGSKLYLDMSGGILKIMEGDVGNIKVWKGEDMRHEYIYSVSEDDISLDNIDFNISNGEVKLDISGDKCELVVPRENITYFDCDVSGGISNIGLSNLDGINISMSGGVYRLRAKAGDTYRSKIDMSGGMLEGDIDLSRADESTLYTDVNGGMLRLRLNVDGDTGIKVVLSSYDSYILIKLNGVKIPGNYIDRDYDSYSKKMIISGDVSGGFISIDIVRK
jgi:DNA-binding transcriptional ArsR family regulator